VSAERLGETVVQLCTMLRHRPVRDPMRLALVLRRRDHWRYGRARGVGWRQVLLRYVRRFVRQQRHPVQSLEWRSGCMKRDVVTDRHGSRLMGIGQRMRLGVVMQANVGQRMREPGLEQRPHHRIDRAAPFLP
jgi:hypothetical protein